MTAPATPGYRPDIDGLRAISVLLVLLFHGFPASMPGGYIGVDVFFVISGYLITSQIHTQARAGHFSFVRFYARRIRRIFPPLITVLAFVALYGYLRLNLADFTALFRHIAAATVFISNFVLWQESGYFDKVAALKPLLHLWSLAIEEQFYLLWPMLLTVATALSRKLRGAVVCILVLACIASFATVILLAAKDSTAAFYSPLARFWELGLGGILAVVQGGHNDQRGLRWPQRAKDIIAGIAGVGLVASACFFSEKMPYAGVMNIIPAICALIIIAAGPTTVFNQRLLASKPMVQLGLISYALYLWHWPLLSFMRIEHGGADSSLLVCLMLVISVVLATLTHKLVENPIRHSRATGVPAFIAATFAGLGILGLVISNGHLQPPRLLMQAQIQDQLRIAGKELFTRGFDHKECNELLPAGAMVLRSCVIWGPQNTKRTVVVWGDSISFAWIPPFYSLILSDGWRVIQLSNVGCAPIVGVRRTDVDGLCSTPELQNEIMGAIRKAKPDVVFLLGRWNLYYHGHIKNDVLVDNSFITDGPGVADAESAKSAFERRLPETLRQLAQIGRVVIFKDTPVLKVPVDIGMTTRPHNFEPSPEEHTRFEAPINRIIDEAVANTPGVVSFDPTSRLCNATRCPAYVDGLPAYADEVHVTPHAAMQFTSEIRELGSAQ